MIWYLAISAMVATGVAYWGQDFPPFWHRAILGLLGGYAALLSAPAFAVFTKLDGILKDSESNDSLEVKRIYEYVQEVRVRLLMFFLVAVFSGLVAGTVSLLLASSNAEDVVARKWVIPLGYACAALIVLFTIRVANIYARLDQFRRRLFEEIQAEKRRADALRELRPSEIKEFAPKQTVAAG